jgi:hypothetical protein
VSSSQADARRLVSEVVDSFEKLEIVVYVHRSGYAVLTPAEIAKGLSISIPLHEVELCVHALQAKRVLEANGPWTVSLAALVEMYDRDRIEVLNLITRSALAKAGRQTANVFADAFVLRKKKGDPDG